MKKRKQPKKFRKKQERAELLLTNLAQVLDACDQAGLKPHLRFDMVFTSAGVVLPPVKRKQHWAVRMMSPMPYDEFPSEDELSA